MGLIVKVQWGGLGRLRREINHSLPDRIGDGRIRIKRGQIQEAGLAPARKRRSSVNVPEVLLRKQPQIRLHIRRRLLGVSESR
jgi:Ribonuclease G/E